MIKTTDEMKERVSKAFAEKKYCVWATSSKDGRPDISFRGSTYVWDDEHIAFWDRSRALSTNNIEQNPNVCMLYFDVTSRIDRTIKDELDKDPERKGYGVLIRVDKIRRYSGDEVFQER